MKELSLDEEMLMWTSYRYCIGRKTYVNSLAPYIGKKYYHLLSDAQAQHTAFDIRRCIADCLRYNGLSFIYDGTVPDGQRNALTDYLNWINENVNNSKDLQGIKKIVCYKESYNAPKKYNIIRCERPTIERYESDFSNLLVWETLASLFDKENYKKVTVNFNGEIKELECFEAWEKEVILEENGEYYIDKPWKYHKVFKSVERYLEGEYETILNSDYIIKVE